MRIAKAVLLGAMLTLCASPSVVSAQGGGQGRGRAAPGTGQLGDEGVSPVEIQRLFDAYVVMQAQRELQLSDDQFAGFLARVRTLQEVRRRGQMQRGRMMQELRRLVQSGAAQDDQIRTELKALADLDVRVASEVKQALEGVDQVLDLRQQVRFRLFEEQMERRKVELLTRARQGRRQQF